MVTFMPILIAFLYLAGIIGAGFFIFRGLYLMTKSLKSINNNVSEILNLLKTREIRKRVN